MSSVLFGSYIYFSEQISFLDVRQILQKACHEISYKINRRDFSIYRKEDVLCQLKFRGMDEI